MENGTCKVNGIEVHYLRTGGNKPSVVLLHGLMTNGACWTPLARVLSKHYDVIMPDARGHGNSSAPHQGYNYYSLASDVLSLIKALELSKPVLLGHSMGGMTAALVASKNPNLLRGLVLADPTFLTPQRQLEVYQSSVAAEHLKILNRPKEEFLAEARTRSAKRSQEIIELLAEARLKTSIDAFEILKPPNPDYIQLISTLNIPSLLVVGDATQVISSEVARELSKLNQHLQVIQISGAGHGLQYDQPERFSTVVKKFLTRLENGISSMKKSL